MLIARRILPVCEPAVSTRRVGDSTSTIHRAAHPGDRDAARREVDDEEHRKPREPTTGPDINGEEVCGGEYVPSASSRTQSMSSA